MPGHSLQTLWEHSLMESIGWHWWLSQDQGAAAAWVDRPPATNCQGETAKELGHSLTLPLQRPLCPYLPGSLSPLSPREDKTLTFLPRHNLQVSPQRKPGSHDSASQRRRPFLSGPCQACWLPGPLWPPFIPFSLFQTEQLGTSVQGSYFLICFS